MELLLRPETWISLTTLTVLEIVLGIDNVVFISILAGKLPADKQKKGMQLGLGLAMITRVLLLFSLTFIMTLTSTLFNLGDWGGVKNILGPEKMAISGRDIILIVGGLFLIYKSTSEIHEKLEGAIHPEEAKGSISFFGVILQILILDIVFSLDSVITAVGMADHVEIMIVAVILAVIVMVFAATAISNFVNKHPTVKMLGLSFLLLIGVSLLAEGFDQHIPKGYIYVAMAFSVLVEMLNLKVKTNAKSPVQLRNIPKE